MHSEADMRVGESCLQHLVSLSSIFGIPHIEIPTLLGFDTGIFISDVYHLFFCLSRPNDGLTLAYSPACFRMKPPPNFTHIMTECPLEHHPGSFSLEKESVGDVASRHAQLSVRGKRILDRLLVLLPSHLKSQSPSRVSPFQPALLFSICDVL